MVPNIRYTLGEGDGNEVTAIVEGISLNTRHSLRDGDGSEVATIIESVASNGRYPLGYYGYRATCYQSVTTCLYDSIASVAGIVYHITFRNNYGFEATTTIENPVSYVRHTLGDGDRGQTAAAIESIVANVRRTFRDGDRDETAAIPESRLSNARHTIRNTIIGDGRGDGDCSAVFIIIAISIFSLKRYSYRQVGIRSDVVVDTIHLKIVGICREAVQ